MFFDFLIHTGFFLFQSIAMKHTMWRDGCQTPTSQTLWGQWAIIKTMTMYKTTKTCWPPATRGNPHPHNSCPSRGQPDKLLLPHSIISGTDTYRHSFTPFTFHTWNAPPTHTTHPTILSPLAPQKPSNTVLLYIYIHVCPSRGQPGKLLLPHTGTDICQHASIPSTSNGLWTSISTNQPNCLN